MYQQLALLSYIRELQGVRGSKLGLETGYMTDDIRGFPDFLQAHIEVLASNKRRISPPSHILSRS